jgi:hypothetical protein
MLAELGEVAGHLWRSHLGLAAAVAAISSMGISKEGVINIDISHI